jgi:uncharacterized protein (DUF2336 family)
MGVNQANLEKLISLAQSPASGRWESLLDEVASLFLEADDDYSDSEIKLYGEVLLAILPQVDLAGRRRLAERLSTAPKAPVSVLHALLDDDDNVAAPICRRAAQIDDAALVVAMRRSDMLRALIAARPALSVAVLEALIKCGDANALQVLLENRKAALRPAMLHDIARFARHRPKLQEAMIARADLPPALADEMFGWVDADLRDTLLQRGDVDEWSVEAVAQGRAKPAAPNGALPIPMRDVPERVIRKPAARAEVPRNSTRAAAQQAGRLRHTPISRYDQRVWTGPLFIGLTALLIALVAIAGSMHT